jgi:Zn-dependent M28 family amino/carboxypeptidase
MKAVPEVTVDVTVEAIRHIIYTRNIIADTITGNKKKHYGKFMGKGEKSKTIVVGSHLDSVAAGPGINDNGR